MSDCRHVNTRLARAYVHSDAANRETRGCLYKRRCDVWYVEALDAVSTHVGEQKRHTFSSTLFHRCHHTATKKREQLIKMSEVCADGSLIKAFPFCCSPHHPAVGRLRPAPV